LKVKRVVGKYLDYVMSHDHM